MLSPASSFCTTPVVIRPESSITTLTPASLTAWVSVRVKRSVGSIARSPAISTVTVVLGEAGAIRAVNVVGATAPAKSAASVPAVAAGAIVPETVVAPVVPPTRSTRKVKKVVPASPSPRATPAGPATNRTVCEGAPRLKGVAENGASGGTPSALWSPSAFCVAKLPAVFRIVR
jgi:hypothetical protein